MKILIQHSVFGLDITWPEGMPVPRVGEHVEVDEGVFVVSQVVYYPHGWGSRTDDDYDPEPSIIVLLGPAGPHDRS